MLTEYDIPLVFQNDNRCLKSNFAVFSAEVVLYSLKPESQRGRRKTVTVSEYQTEE